MSDNKRVVIGLRCANLAPFICKDILASHTSARIAHRLKRTYGLKYLDEKKEKKIINPMTTFSWTKNPTAYS